VIGDGRVEAIDPDSGGCGAVPGAAAWGPGSMLTGPSLFLPRSLDRIERIRAVRAKAKELALLILETTPASADQSAAIRQVREAVMTASAAIVLERPKAQGEGEREG
jgi:hypothetical protein